MKELYELDVALFGEERALGMWCFEDMFGELWECSKEIYPGAEHPELAEFRRRDDAPSIWSNAPEWAQIVARDSVTGNWFWCEHIGKGGKWQQIGAVPNAGTVTEDLADSLDIISRRPKIKRWETKLDDRVKLLDVPFEKWPEGVDAHFTIRKERVVTIYRAPDLYADATLLLQEPELVVWRDADGQLHHAPARDVLVNPDRDGLAAEVLSRMAGADIAPEHIAELRAQGLI